MGCGLDVRAIDGCEAFGALDLEQGCAELALGAVEWTIRGLF